MSEEIVLDEVLGVGSVIPHRGRLYVVVDWQEDHRTGIPYWICEDNFGRRIRIQDVTLYEEGEVLAAMAVA